MTVREEHCYCPRIESTRIESDEYFEVAELLLSGQVDRLDGQEVRINAREAETLAALELEARLTHQPVAIAASRERTQ